MSDLKQTLISQFEENFEEIRKQWVITMQNLGHLKALTHDDIERQSKAICTTVINCLKTNSFKDAEAYAESLAKKAVLEAMTVDQIISGFLVLRDLYGRFIKKWYKDDFNQFFEVLDIYEPVARKIVYLVSNTFIQERDMVVKQQQEAILKLSTPLVQLWENVVLLPLIGVLDSVRAKQLIESVLMYIGQSKTEIIIMDIAGIAAIDTKTAHHILLTIQAAKLMGTEIIITGIRPEVATTLVTLGINMTGIETRSTLRDGVEYAFDKLGFKMLEAPKRQESREQSWKNQPSQS